MLTTIIIVFVFVIIFIVGATILNNKQKAEISNNVFAENNCSITKKIGDLLIDESTKRWSISGLSYLFNFSDIIDYEYIENGENFSKGRGSSVSKNIYKMYIQIYTSVSEYPSVSIIFFENLKSSPTSTDSYTYRLCKNTADQIMATLKQITLNNNLASNKTNSSADEIAKYKSLLDSGAITQEEYEAKKKQLLNL